MKKQMVQMFATASSGGRDMRASATMLCPRIYAKKQEEPHKTSINCYVMKTPLGRC